MLAAQIAALVLALAKFLPVIERIMVLVEDARNKAKANALHNAIDDAIAQARREAAVCPRPDCPVFRGVRRAEPARE